MLTYLDLSVTRPEPSGDIADRYRMHQTLRRCFGDQHLLYRVNRDDRTVLVRSTHPGDFTTLADGYLRKTIEIRSEPEVEYGGVYKLSLTANPTKTRAGKRWGLYGYDARVQWVRDRLRKSGFDVITIECVESGWIESPAGVKALSVEYRGVVAVMDAALAQEAVDKGVGSGKAWGLGMLLLT